MLDEQQIMLRILSSRLSQQPSQPQLQQHLQPQPQPEHDENVNNNSELDNQQEEGSISSFRSKSNNSESGNKNDTSHMIDNRYSLSSVNAEQSNIESSTSFADLIETKRIASQLRVIDSSLEIN